MKNFKICDPLIESHCSRLSNSKIKAKKKQTNFPWITFARVIVKRYNLRPCSPLSNAISYDIEYYIVVEI